MRLIGKYFGMECLFVQILKSDLNFQYFPIENSLSCLIDQYYLKKYIPCTLQQKILHTPPPSYISKNGTGSTGTDHRQSPSTDGSRTPSPFGKFCFNYRNNARQEGNKSLLPMKEKRSLMESESELDYRGKHSNSLPVHFEDEGMGRSQNPNNSMYSLNSESSFYIICGEQSVRSSKWEHYQEQKVDLLFISAFPDIVSIGKIIGDHEQGFLQHNCPAVYKCLNPSSS